MKKLLILILVLLANSLFTTKANAASLQAVSDTVTTSRPSASTPLTANAAANANMLSVTDNNSRFLASDSAIIRRTSTGLPVSTTPFTIASQSGLLTTVYVNGTGIPAAAQAGTDVVVTPITAMHTISFRTTTVIPIGGKIIINFPVLTGGASSNTASPSATTYAFNGLDGDTGTKVKYNFSTGSAACTIAVSSPTITCTTTTAIVSAGTTVTFLIGCTANSGASCTTQSPTLINPTKPTTAGTADRWYVSIKTQDNAGTPVDLDTGKAIVGSIESVLVLAQVDPTMTFTITGIGDATAVNSGNSTGCAQAETTNTGIAATTTEVNLGVVNVMPAVDIKLANITAQRINITTNATNGYSLTATSSGHLVNPENGVFFNDWTSDASFVASTHGFGIHPCGLDAPVAYNEGGGAHSTQCFTQPAGSSANECQYAWPTATTAITLATRSSGPVTGAGGAGITSIAYAAGSDANIPAGTYRTAVTYVATPTF